jgi:hypothetical protein
MSYHLENIHDPAAHVQTPADALLADLVARQQTARFSHDTMRAIDLALLFRERAEKLAARVAELEAIAPRKIRRPDGAVLVWHCPEEFVPWWGCVVSPEEQRTADQKFVSRRMLFRGRYVGDRANLRGETAMLQLGPVPGTFVAQFDKHATGLGFGWHEFAGTDFEEVYEPR